MRNLCALVLFDSAGLRSLGVYFPDGTDSPYDYNLAGRNCQDFADALRDEHDRLGGMKCIVEFVNAKCPLPDLPAF